MDEDQGQERTPVAADDSSKSSEQLRAEIEDVREDLGDTAAALAAKTDVKARARERADEIKANATAKKDDLVSKLPGGAGGGTSASGPGGSTAAGAGTSPLVKVQTFARENPVPTAALGALIGGFLIGRVTKGD